jgi:hypothetical protein
VCSVCVCSVCVCVCVCVCVVAVLAVVYRVVLCTEDVATPDSHNTTTNMLMACRQLPLEAIFLARRSLGTAFSSAGPR